jgi:hypothetical protein
MLDLVRVDRVTQLPTSSPDVTEFTVYAMSCEPHPRSLVYRTLNPWRASLCQAAATSQQKIWITARVDATWRTKNITHVEWERTSDLIDPRRI